jgi:putative copper resistance protein D
VALLIDLFGYLSVVLHGLTVTAQSVAVGGVLFLVLLARPFADRLARGEALLAIVTKIALFGALALILCDALVLALQGAVLVGTLDISPMAVLGADFARALLVKMATASVLVVLLWFGHGGRPGLAGGIALLVAAAVELAAATLTTHAAARLSGQGPLLLAEWVHQLGAAIWIGGLPCFLAALALVRDGEGWRLVGARFSRMSMLGVVCILASGIVMWRAYVGDFSGEYGTAYGVMVSAKIALFTALLLLGLGNFLTVSALGRGPGASVVRMRRFAEVEFGIGITIFFAAASLTSVPPAVDLTQDRVSWHEIVERNWPVVPRLASPGHDALAQSELQAQLDAEAARTAQRPQPAFVPGDGTIAPRNAADIAWSEYNHHWSGIFVLLIGLLALADRAGLRAARHWPLLFLLMAGFLALRADPEVWPMGSVGFFASLRDVEVLQHRMFVLLIVIFGLFEWRVRTGANKSPRAALVFPLITALGAALLLTHTHAIANVRDQLLIEITHTPLALAGVAAGWARWLELRLPGRGGRIAGWVWPIALMLVGLILLDYREA